MVVELSDEFEGDELHTTKWLPYHPYWKGRKPSEFSPENVVVRNGKLELRSTLAVKDIAQVKNREEDIWVRSSCLSSIRPIAFYGYYEARIKASRLSMTSSFWFQGKYSEIDVAEQIGAPEKVPARSQFMFMNTHYFPQSWKDDKPTPRTWKMPLGAADQFHTYAVWWKDKNTVWFYHDGVRVANVRTKGDFLEPMYLFFDTEVFSWEGLPTIDSLSDSTRNVMYVDWVRSWRLVRSTHE
jgi:beta-glucanase (GH16 family)